MKPETKGAIGLAVANCIFGLTFMFSALALEVAVPFVINAVRFTIVFFILTLAILTRKFKFSLKGKPVWIPLLMGLFHPVLYFLCENYGMLMTSSAMSGTMLALTPVFTLILGRLLLGEKTSRSQVFFCFLSVFGVLLTTTGRKGGNFSWLGILLLLCSALACTLFSICTKKASLYFNTLEKTYLQFGVGAGVFLVLMLIQCRGQYEVMLLRPLANWQFWRSMLYLTCACSLTGVLLQNYSIKYVPVSRASVLANLATVISIFAGIVILKEPFSLIQITGAAIILISVYGITHPSKKSL